MNGQKPRSRTLRADLLLVLGLHLLAGAVWGVLLLTGTKGARAVVTVDGVRSAEYPLDRDRTVLLRGADGGENTLQIQAGQARIISADCPDRVCVRTGPIRYAGETIICLPHRLVVTIEGGEDSGADAP